MSEIFYILYAKLIATQMVIVKIIQVETLPNESECYKSV